MDYLVITLRNSENGNSPKDDDWKIIFGELESPQICGNTCCIKSEEFDDFGIPNYYKIVKNIVDQGLKSFSSFNVNSDILYIWYHFGEGYHIKDEHFETCQYVKATKYTSDGNNDSQAYQSIKNLIKKVKEGKDPLKEIKKRYLIDETLEKYVELWERLKSVPATQIDLSDFNTIKDLPVGDDYMDLDVFLNKTDIDHASIIQELFIP